jgi:hypothetical protein
VEPHVGTLQLLLWFSPPVGVVVATLPVHGMLEHGRLEALLWRILKPFVNLQQFFNKLKPTVSTTFLYVCYHLR